MITGDPRSALASMKKGAHLLTLPILFQLLYRFSSNLSPSKENSLQLVFGSHMVGTHMHFVIGSHMHFEIG